ncbi:MULTISPECIES: pyruvate kinase [Corynebacterium]|uniref:pyruvate kinase n=1 Tax=Corynebacterium TaxID=1716 RepID=UPI000696858C|nr:pyruvate kinase [Corynebacterium parakroppenstedtii]MCF6792026.1 pyruvate kinase [Corynebacterium parakroppenstedtii]MCF6818562.1 pyruvate kinase [Corynebacterium parakroppenstedtii]MCF6820640.1 pyruvate kinase [Corynebacterium parakroppenstedtii]MCZ9303566.1 pyruvate kinase [Corynebacterium sp. c24U_166]
MEQNGHNGELNDASTSGASSSKATTTNSATTSLNELIRGVSSLLTMLSEVDHDKRDLIDAADAEHREGARNVQHFARLQADDARHIIAQLRAVGIRVSDQAPVADQLRAAKTLLQNLGGQSSDDGSADCAAEGEGYDIARLAAAIERSQEQLASNSSALLGEPRDGMPSCVMVTLPTEAADDPDLVQSFADAGMDIARINCAHDTPEAWRAMAANVRAASARVGREIKISMDLPGPKLRVGAIEPGPRIARTRVTRTKTGRILTPSKLWITPFDHNATTPAPVPEGLPGRLTLAIQVDPEWLQTVNEGDELSMLDARGSKRYMTVHKVTDEGVLAYGRQNVYLANGSLVACQYIKTRIHGIGRSEQRVHVDVGSRLTLTSDPTPTDPTDDIPAINCGEPQAIRSLDVGSRVLFDDAKIECEVTSVTRAGEKDAEDNTAEYDSVELVAVHTREGGKNLREGRGIHFPGIHVPLPAMTDEDRAILPEIVRTADIIAPSYVRSAEDLTEILDAIEKEIDVAASESEDPAAVSARIRNLGVMLKIESEECYNDLPNVVTELLRHRNSGVMIARGDLAMELGFSRMSEAREQIMDVANAAHIPTIFATQVLETMAKSGLPSRAEITDADVALRTQGVMLNKGTHIPDAINILNRIGKALNTSDNSLDSRSRGRA